MKAQSAIVIYEYQTNKIEFDLGTPNLMVNATAMAKLFGKLPKDFLKTEPTQLFIDECLKKDYSPYLGVQNEDDLFTARQNSGTWMHRILALKFAAWLSPSFELWVYQTIDNLVFGTLRKDKEETMQFAIRKMRIDELTKQLRSDEHFLELERLELEQRQASYRRTKNFANNIQEFLPSK